MGRWWFAGLMLLSLPVYPQALVLQDTFHFPVEPTFSTGGSDVWGYVDSSGTKYCLMGTLTGVSVVDITHGVVIQTVSGPVSGDAWFHRDIETYGHYAYVASELRGNREGIMILDLSTLPDSVRYVGSYVSPTGLVTAHNLFVDTSTGYMYVVRTFHGVEVVSLANPEQPMSLGLLPDTIPSNLTVSHDVFARNDTVLVADGENGTFSLWDLSDKQNPVLLRRITVPETSYNPAPYVHTIWMTDSIPMVLVGNEDYGYRTPLKMYRLLPGDSLVLLNTYQGSFAIPHNVYTVGSLLYIAGYEYGATVASFSPSGQVQEHARYDTYPASDGTYYAGAWGVYAFPDSTVCISNMEDVLYVFKFDASISVKEHTAYRTSFSAHASVVWTAQTPLTLPVPHRGPWKVTLLDPLGRTISLPARSLTPRTITLLPMSLPPGRYGILFRSLNQKYIVSMVVLEP